MFYDAFYKIKESRHTKSQTCYDGFSFFMQAITKSTRLGWPKYDETGKCLGVKSRTFTLPAGQTVEVEAPEENSNYGQFVYETATGTPLAMARKSLS